MKMRQEKYKKSYYIPTFGRSVEVRAGQYIDPDGILGKDLLKYYGEDCIMDGDDKSLMEKVASGDIGGTSLTTEQIAALSKAEVLVDTGLTDAELLASQLKAHELVGLEASASEIDDTSDFYKDNFSSDMVNIFNGTSSFVNLDKDYIVLNTGDYIEFEARFFNFNSSFAGDVYDFRYHIGFINESTFEVRGNTATKYSFPCSVDHNKLNTFKLIRNGTLVELYVNDVFQSSNEMGTIPLKFNQISKVYNSTTFCKAWVTYVKLSISSVITTFTDFTSLTNTAVTYEAKSKDYNINAKNDNLHIKFNGSTELIIVKSFSSGYIAYQFTREIDIANKKDNWTINQVFASDVFGNLITPISSTGEWENAISIQGASDFMGGHYHGDETLSLFYCLIDGVRNSLTSAFDIYCKSLEFVQKSNLTGPTGIANAGIIVATSTKRWNFNAKTKNELSNKIKWNTSEIISYGYMFMCPIYRLNNSQQITHTGIVSDGYVQVDLTNSGYGDINYVGTSFGKNIRLWGDKYAISVDVDETSPWSATTSKMFFRDDNFRNKIYVAPYYNGYTTSINEEWYLKVKYDVAVI